MVISLDIEEARDLEVDPRWRLPEAAPAPGDGH